MISCKYDCSLFYRGVFKELDCKIVITVSEHGGNILHAWKLEEEYMAKESWLNAGRLSRAEGRMQRTRWLSLWYVVRESVRCEADETLWPNEATGCPVIPSTVLLLKCAIAHTLCLCFIFLQHILIFYMLYSVLCEFSVTVAAIYCAVRPLEENRFSAQCVRM